MWIADVQVVLPERVIPRGAVEITGRHIGQVIEGECSAPDVVRAPGMLIAPGFIDLHGDMLEREIEPRPRAFMPYDLALYELDKRLAASGITTAYAAVGFAWHRSDLRTQENATRIIETIHACRDHLLTDARVHARFEIGNPDTVPVLDRLLREQMVQLVSIMDHSPGQGQYSDTSRYTQFLKEWLGFTEAQLQPIYARIDQRMAVAQVQERDWTMARAIVETALQHGVLAASHDDDTVAKVTAQAAMGITISEFPINLESAHAARDFGMHVIMGAPNAYRGASNTGNLSAREAIHLGVVDVLATDYYPPAMLQAIWKLAHDHDVTLHDAFNLITRNPAHAMRLHDRGALRPGLLADLTLIEPGVTPRVRATLRHGRVIFADAVGINLLHDADRLGAAAVTAGT